MQGEKLNQKTIVVFTVGKLVRYPVLVATDDVYRYILVHYNVLVKIKMWQSSVLHFLLLIKIKTRTHLI